MFGQEQTLKGFRLAYPWSRKYEVTPRDRCGLPRKTSRKDNRGLENLRASRGWGIEEFALVCALAMLQRTAAEDQAGLRYRSLGFRKDGRVHQYCSLGS